MAFVRGEHSQAIVEFALTALIFLTMLVFIVDGSRIFWNYLTVTEAGASVRVTRSCTARSPRRRSGLTIVRP